VIRLQSQQDNAAPQNRNIFYAEYVGDGAVAQRTAAHRTYGWWGDKSHGYADLFLFSWTDGSASQVCSWTGAVTTH
jgi:hypothetical protein